MFKGNFKKQKNKFIWTSHAGRGFEFLLDIFDDLKNELPFNVIQVNTNWKVRT